MKLVFGAALCLALCVVTVNSENNRLKEVFAWKFVDYAWENPEDREAAIQSGEFVPANNLPLGLEVWKDKLFITVPRWKDGVVSTLNYVKITDDDDDDEVTPEPTDEPETTEPEDEPEESTTPPPPTDPTTPPPPTDPTTPPPPTDPTTPPPPTDPTTPPPPTDPTTPPPPTDPTTPPPPTDPTTPPPPTDPTTPPPPTDPTTPPPPTDPTTPPPPTDPTTPPDDDPTTAGEEPSTLPPGSILPMPARRLNVRSVDEVNSDRLRRSPGEDDAFDMSSWTRSSKKSDKKRRKEKEESEEEEEEKKKKKKKKKSKKEDEDEDEDEDRKKNKDKKKDKKDNDKKDKDKKKKKKKKCKPKPKPTTAAPPPPTDPETTDPTDTTDATAATETTAPPPPAPRSPALIPYPSFAANRVAVNGTKADGPAPIVSVFRVWADACDRLWVMDTGVADILGNTKVISKPRILIYNLNNDELIKTYEFKDTDSEEHSFFANIVVDTKSDKCDEAFAYVPDLGGYGIVSYDLANDKTRRIKHNYFHFDPLAGDMEVGGVNFQWTDGVFSIALTKPKDDDTRTAYFHCLASTKEFSVSTKVLKNPDASKDSYYDYKLIGDRGEKSQSSASYIHEDTGIMFYTQLQKDSVNCWNTNKPMTPENIVEVASDNETMIFTNDLKVDREGNLWVLTDKLPVFIYRGLDDSEVNYRIFTATVDEAVAGTNCAP